MSVAEIIKNLLHGTFDLTDEQTKQLIRYRNVLRQLASSKNTFNWKQRQSLMAKYSKAIHIILTVIKEELSDLLA